MPDAPWIRFSHVRKAFGPKIIYTGLDLEIVRGEILTICGGSGVGKSVMLKMLIGLLPVDAGSIRFDGLEVTKLEERELSTVRRRIAMLFQSAALFDSISVGENVGYGLEEHFSRNDDARGARRRRVAWALELVGLPGSIEAMPNLSDLSGGMRKRVEARARDRRATRGAALRRADDGSRSDQHGAPVNRLITGLQQRLNITSIVVTHDMKSAFSISDRIAMVHSGRIISIGPVEEFRQSPDMRVTDFIEGRAPVKESVEALLNS